MSIEATLDAFYDSIVEVQAKFFGDLATVYSNLHAMSDAKILQAAQQASLFELLLKSGYKDSMKILRDGYNKEIKAIIKEAQARGIVINKVTAGLIEGLKNLEIENVLRSASGFSMTVKQELFASLVAGEPTEVAVKKIIDKLGPHEVVVDGVVQKRAGQLASHQARVAANDSIRNFVAATRRKTFEADPTVRWEYVGPIIDTTRDACLETLNDPRQAEGWTIDEIDAHAADVYGDGSSVDFVFRGGFNCQHEWMVKEE